MRGRASVLTDNDQMISTDLARALREVGLRWHPATGDAFSIDKPGFESDVFTVSDMTIEAHQFDTGTILGFNGTTEWALDSVALEDSLWLPREDQLRSLLGGMFRSLRRVDHHATASYRVEIELRGAIRGFDASDPALAYGNALLAVIRLSTTAD